MKEYIDKSEIEYPYMTMTLWGLNKDTCHAYNEGVKAAADAIAAIPAADVVERKHGEWVDVVFDPVWKKMKATCTSCSHRGEIRVKSNYCGFVVPDSDFCPSCGADMRGESDG